MTARRVSLVALASASGLLKVGRPDRAALLVRMGAARGLGPMAALEALKIERYPNEDGTETERVELDPHAIVAAVEASGTHEFVTIAYGPARVWIGVLKAAPGRPESWVSCCPVLDCRQPVHRLSARPSCCPCCRNGLAEVVEVPAGWKWVGSSDWTLARVHGTGAFERPDPEKLWTKAPWSLLWGRAVREARDRWAPSILSAVAFNSIDDAPVEVDDEPLPPASAPRSSAIEAKRRREEAERARPKPTRKQAESSMALAAHLAGNPPVTIDGQEAERERVRVEAEGIARLEAEAAADPRPAIADPDWFADEDKGTEGAAEVSRAPAHAAGTSPAAASTTLPAGNTDAPRLADPAASSEVVGLPAGGAAGLETVDTRLSIPPDACWTCDRAPCICLAPADQTLPPATHSAAKEG